MFKEYLHQIFSESRYPGIPIFRALHSTLQSAQLCCTVSQIRTEKYKEKNTNHPLGLAVPLLLLTQQSGRGALSKETNKQQLSISAFNDAP